MVENIPEEIIKDFQFICHLHEQAVCDHDKCREFSENLSELLIRLEDMEFYRLADRLMSILLHCKPKEASHCEKATLVGEMMKETTKEVQKVAGK
jgi:regulator of sigma D